MRGKLFPIFLIGALIACGKEGVTSKESDLNIRNHSDFTEDLHQQKAQIDSLVSRQQNQIVVLVKTPSSDSLIEVINEKWPEEIETTYNILSDSSGTIIFTSESPYSESGDWNIEYKHYFDKNGNTYAYEKVVKAFNTFCPSDEYLDGLTTEVITKLYTPNHDLVDSTYKMTDEQNKNISKKKCQQEVNSENQIFESVMDYLAARRINTK